MPSKQETANKIMAHMRKQGKQARDDKFGSCCYRTPEGLACAAGCLIEPEDYTADFEGDAVILVEYSPFKTKPGSEAIAAVFDTSALPTEWLTIVGKYIEAKGHDVRLVYQFQYIHDNLRPKDWEQKFKDLCVLQNLTYTPPEVGCADKAGNSGADHSAPAEPAA